MRAELAHRAHEPRGRGTPPRQPAALQPRLGNRVVQRLMSLDAFQASSSGWGVRMQVSWIDQALTAFHATPADRFGAWFNALLRVVNACRIYLSSSSLFNRQKPAVERLLVEASGDLQRGLRAEVVAAKRRTTPIEVFRALGAIVDAANRAEAVGARSLHPFLAEVAIAMEALLKDLSEGDVRGIIGDDVARLRRLEQSARTPQVTRQLLGEILGNLDQVGLRRTAGAAAGTRIAKESDRIGKRYLVELRLVETGGSLERIGTAAHELTHVAAAERFGEPAMVLLADQNAAAPEIAALAVARGRRVAELVRLLAASTSFSPLQRDLVTAKLKYAGGGGQFLKYLAQASEKLTKYRAEAAAASSAAQAPRRAVPRTMAELNPEGRALVERGELLRPELYAKLYLVASDQAAKEFTNTLVEYDTVITQLLVYLRLWGIQPPSRLYPNAFYSKLLEIGAEVHAFRSRFPRAVRPAAIATPTVDEKA